MKPYSREERDHKIKPEDYPEIVEEMLGIDLTELQKEMIVRSASIPPGAKLCMFPGGRIRLVVPRESGENCGNR